MSVKVTVFDGADCIGGNKIHLDFDGHGLFFDFGQNYHQLGEYYSDFLQPRSATRGIHDLVKMGLVPHLKQYRSDLVPADMDANRALDVQVDAVLISHAHMDHIGHAGLFDLEIPFVASPTTMAIMKALRDCGSTPEGETVYGSLRDRTPADGRVLKVASSSDPYQGRSFIPTSTCSADLEVFWATSPAKKKELEARGMLSCGSLDFEFQSFDVDHSIYGATAYGVDTSSGWVVYTGDLRAHGRYGDKTWKFAEKAAELQPELLIIEGTRTSRDADAGDRSEEKVARTCMEAARHEEELIVADFGPRNFERLETFKDIAQRLDRTLVVTVKDAYFLEALRTADGIDRMRGMRVYLPLKGTTSGIDDKVHQRYEGLFVDPGELHSAPREHILCFSYFDMSQLLDIKPEAGTYIYSSSEAYSEEQVVDFRRLWHWLEMFHFKIKGFWMEGKKGEEVPRFDHDYHASGHASVEDLERLIEVIAPKRVMPVHTEDIGPFRRFEKIELVPARKGATIDL